MKIIVGLGNPGKEYEYTRHNFGFMALMDFWEKHREKFGAWKTKEQALVASGVWNNEKVMLAMPQTYMNKSGDAVYTILKYFKLLPGVIGKLLRKQISFDNLWVIHDDIDLPLDITRISVGAASGGHKGVQSIIQKLHTKNFIRFRLGIRGRTQHKVPVDQFVLEKFSEEELMRAKTVLQKTTNALEAALAIDINAAMNTYNR